MTTKLLLPVEAYTSQTWFEEEQKTIFSRTWQFVGMVGDLPEPGNYICASVGSVPIIVVRGDDGELHAFHNMCRHRGTQLLELTGNRTKVIKCPYHDWVYALDGTLIGVPQKKTQFPTINMSEWSLFPVQMGIWNEMVFVNPDMNAPGLDVFLADVPQYLGPYRVAELEEADKRQYIINCNWKIFVENYVDIYHLSHLHSETLNMYDHSKLSHRYTGQHWVSYDPPTAEYRKYLDTNPNDYLPLIDTITSEQWGAYTHMLFPCFGIAATEFTWTTLQVKPFTPTQTQVETRTRTMPIDPITRSVMSAYEKVSGGFWKWMGYKPEDDPLKSGDFMLEDIYACEQQQKAMASPYFEFGLTSVDMEQPIVDFQRHVLQQMGKL